MPDIRGTMEIMPSEARRIGFHFAWGVLACVGLMGGFGILIGLLLQGPDNCDAGWLDRCGMRVLTDHKTGQEYLVTSGGGIIERRGK